MGPNRQLTALLILVSVTYTCEAGMNTEQLLCMYDFYHNGSCEHILYYVIYSLVHLYNNMSLE